ncbi:hypothetical protein JOC62_001983 [Clostridium sardiniense]|nr:hypothetical protein [Clostridium sardiniense]
MYGGSIEEVTILFERLDKKIIANIPFEPFITVLSGVIVNGKQNYATLGAYGVVS